MKKIPFCLLCLCCLHAPLFSQWLPSPSFDSYFRKAVMRIDYFHVADAETESITLDQIYVQGMWAGNTGSLIDYEPRGSYFIKVYDPASNQLIYSQSFSSYCGEYRTTDAASKKIKRTYHESARIPCPLKSDSATHRGQYHTLR